MDKSFTPELITPQWAALMFVAVVLLLFGPRKYVLPTFLVATAFLGLENRVYILGLNFFTARILLLAAWARVLVRGEHRGLRFLPLDKAWILFCIWSLLTETLQREMAGAVYGVANYVYDALGAYFLVRVFLRDADGFVHLIKTLGSICCIFAAFMSIEFVTGRNFLAPLGAAFDTVQVREGRLRCQATFQHPVLAGTYGAVLLPIFAACWWQPRMKKLAVTGCFASTIMVLTANSGGPLMSFAAVLLTFGLWPARRNLRLLRWGLLFLLVALHLVMKAPVWALISRLNVVPGASSYHRYVLLDSFIKHFGDWWLIGTVNTESWGWLTEDVANYFCIVAKHAGLLGLLLFIRVLVLGFREVGLRRREVEASRPTEILVWAFGASLFVHVVSFFGTSYFDQTIVLWHFTLGMVASLSLLTAPQERRAEPEAAGVLEPGSALAFEKPLPAD